MTKQLKTIEIKPNQKREGKAFGCSEIFTLDNKGKVIKKEIREIFAGRAWAKK